MRPPEDLFAGAHQLLGQQVAHPSGGLDRPGPWPERLRPGQQFRRLLARRSHSDLSQRMLVAADGHCRVGCLVGVDPDDHRHPLLLRGRLGTARALLVRIWCTFLFRATRGKDRTGSPSLEGQSTRADGWHLASYPVRTSKRYERAAASAKKSQPGTFGIGNHARRVTRSGILTAMERSHGSPSRLRPLIRPLVALRRAMCCGAVAVLVASASPAVAGAHVQNVVAANGSGRPTCSSTHRRANRIGGGVLVVVAIPRQRVTAQRLATFEARTLDTAFGLCIYDVSNTGHGAHRSFRIYAPRTVGPSVGDAIGQYLRKTRLFSNVRVVSR